MNRTKYAVFTMDVESFADTECISNLGVPVDTDLLDGFDQYMGILDKYGIKSTLFTVGNLAPKMFGRLKKYINKGHRLALHSYEHIAPMDVQPAQFREQVSQAKKQMGELFGTEIQGFRAPCFSLDKERLDILKDVGFKYDSSHLDFKARHTVKLDLSDFKKVRNGIFRQKDFFEFGLAKEKVFGNPFPISGGGYVRIGNWGFVKTLIRKYVSENDYYVFYLHPFELTSEKVPFFPELKSYDKFYLKFGIDTYAKKIEYIIQLLKKYGYQFVTFEELSDIMRQEVPA